MPGLRWRPHLQAAAPGRHGAERGSQGAVETITGEVAETMDASNYTYLRVKSARGDVWVATAKTPVKVGEKVVVPLEQAMENFHSASLKRDFPLIYFVSGISRQGETAPPPMAVAHGASGMAPAPKAPVTVQPNAPPAGGSSIADVWANRTKLAGKTVTVRGTVVKFNGGILDRNWVHLQDGSGKAADGTNDLTVTHRRRGEGGRGRDRHRNGCPRQGLHRRLRLPADAREGQDLSSSAGLSSLAVARSAEAEDPRTRRSDRIAQRMTDPIRTRAGRGGGPAELDLAAGLARLGYERFRPGQREAIETLLSAGRLLLVAPTGGGKSLTYQLPATLLPGTTIVISPLIALMQDQTQALQQRGVAVTFLSSTLESGEMRRRMVRAAAGDYKLLYVAPERLTYPGFKALLADLEIPLVAVDEAHCISQWGHDFRPEYLQIGDLLADVRPSRMLACTATATPVVRDEILARLGLGADTPQILQGFARPNLVLRATEIRARANAPVTWTPSCSSRSAGPATLAASPSSTR